MNHLVYEAKQKKKGKDNILGDMVTSSNILLCLSNGTNLVQNSTKAANSHLLMLKIVSFLFANWSAG